MYEFRVLDMFYWNYLVLIREIKSKTINYRNKPVPGATCNAVGGGPLAPGGPGLIGTLVTTGILVWGRPGIEPWGAWILIGSPREGTEVTGVIEGGMRGRGLLRGWLMGVPTLNIGFDWTPMFQRVNNNQFFLSGYHVVYPYVKVCGRSCFPAAAAAPDSPPRGSCRCRVFE